MTESTPSTNNKRIAKNTLLLYFRMLFTMLVSLYTSRVVLDTLGVEDFGIYNVVGGVVMLFFFLKDTLSTSTSRFIAFQLGKGDELTLKKVFCTSINIHFCIGIIILLFAETVGLWFVSNKLVIPEARRFAALVVYQLSVLNSIVIIMQVPYNASLIAHERMNIFAYIGVVEVILKLIIVYLLMIVGVDKLILYACLMLSVTIIISLIYRIYCVKKLACCRYSFIVDKITIKSMLSFSFWDLYGNISWMLSTQGVNILLNMFFGPIINAATGIAAQVRTAVSGFSNNFILAARPQIIKSYANGDYQYMIRLITNTSKYSFFLLFFVSLPLIIENKFVLSLWLKNTPDYATIFCQLNLVYSLIGAVFYPIVTGIHAVGKIKGISFITGSAYLLVLPVSYVFLKLEFSPYVPFVINIIFLLIASLINQFLLKKYIRYFSIWSFMKESVLICILVVIASLIIPVISYFYFQEGWIRFLCVCGTSVISTILAVYFIALGNSERSFIIRYIRKYI